VNGHIPTSTLEAVLYGLRKSAKGFESNFVSDRNFMSDRKELCEQQGGALYG
jgi:hypothetical protein